MGPHLALEAIAYVLCGAAGMFPSKAIDKYGLASSLTAEVMASALRMLGLGLALVILGALWEAVAAKAILRWMWRMSGVG